MFSKGFYSEKCYLEASTALCFEWAGYLVPETQPVVAPNATTLLDSTDNVCRGSAA